MSDLTARGFRTAAARWRQASRYSPTIVRPVMATMARAASRIASLADRARSPPTCRSRTVGSFWPYATTLFDYIHRAMPYPTPGSLSTDETYAVTAYMLSLNGIIPADSKVDKESLPKIKMPNRDGFIPEPEFDPAKLFRKK
ncbi:hypothetical protein ACVWW2_006708 [Bradyrhizobium sp. LM4.3]